MANVTSAPPTALFGMGHVKSIRHPLIVGMVVCLSDVNANVNTLSPKESSKVGSLGKFRDATAMMAQKRNLLLL